MADPCLRPYGCRPTRRPPSPEVTMTAARSAALAATAVLVLLPAVVPALSAQSPNTLSPAERAAGWRLLFDGKTTAGWRGFKMDSMPAGWQVVDGALTRVAAAGDIVTREQFRDFELSLRSEEHTSELQSQSNLVCRLLLE